MGWDGSDAEVVGVGMGGGHLSFTVPTTTTHRRPSEAARYRSSREAVAACRLSRATQSLNSAKEVSPLRTLQQVQHGRASMA